MLEIRGKGRLIVVLAVAALFVTIIIIRYAYLMLFLPAQEKTIPVRFPSIERGPILDRNGKILAITTSLDSISAWIPNLDDIEQTAALLAETLKLDRDYLVEKLADHSGFVWIKRQITPTESERIRSLINDKKLPGISLEPEFGRNYPERSFGSHLIGYVGVDNTGLDGIEWSFQKELFPVVMGSEIDEIYGNQVFLTIDMRIQYLLEQIAQNALAENRADSVMLLAMDAKSGEIMAYVSVPGFDPNNFTEYSDSERLNRPIRTAYEPGSVFKIFTISSFLQLGGISAESSFYCGGIYEDSEHGFTITDLAAHGTVGPAQIIKYSCNVGAALASETVAAEDFYNMLRRFGFGKPTGLPLAGETAGILRKPSAWSSRSKPTIAFGQEISVSAVQIAAGATVFANAGLLLKPLLVKKIVSPEGKSITEYTREPVAEVLSPEVSRAMLLMMETATGTGGTAARAKIEGVRISAKTGTAQVTNPETGNYYEDRHIASFLGIFPTDNPQLIIYVVINNPKVERYYGSIIAAPVFKQAAEECITVLGIPTSESQVVVHSGRIKLPSSEEIIIGGEMPDLTGKPKRLLLPLFKRQDLDLVMYGEGYVVRQIPLPGTPIKEGTQLILEFE